jgi:4-hydroxy-tetrahydrodipicolinate synthase
VADSLGLYSLVPPRPILPLSGEARARVEAALEALGAP